MSFLKLQSDVYLHGPTDLLIGREITNHDLVEWLQDCSIDAEKISYTSGIHRRYWVDPESSCKDLAVAVARKLFNLKPSKEKKIGQLILATTSGDYISPPTSPLVQHDLGLNKIGAFDLGAACAGFVSGLYVSSALAVSTQHTILLIAAEIRSKFLNQKDYSTASLFGDGAAACFISREPDDAEFKILALQLFSDGEIGDAVCIPAGGSLLPAAKCDQIDNFYITMKNGAGLFVKAVDGIINLVTEFLENVAMTVHQIDWLVMHQANIHLMHSVIKKLNIPKEKMVLTLPFTGNTSGASTGIALADLVSNKKLRPGQKILLVSVGGGGIGACGLLEVIRNIN